ncbi:MAG: MarC family protein [Rhodobacteraceae bacterium]|nr:MarC family protein [Paracoccaceae bacterium]MBR9820135.1 MarC family protein [Paracoccaceae bacterium]
MMDMAATIKEFIIFFVVINPLGAIPVFMLATNEMPRVERNRHAVRTVVLSGVVLVACYGVGKPVLQPLNLNAGAFPLAGGVILLLVSLSMIFNGLQVRRRTSATGSDWWMQPGIPFSAATMATPAAITVILILADNHGRSWFDDCITMVIMALVLCLTFTALIAAEPIQRCLGLAAGKAARIVLGMVLAVIALDRLLDGYHSLALS